MNKDFGEHLKYYRQYEEKLQKQIFHEEIVNIVQTLGDILNKLNSMDRKYIPGLNQQGLSSTQKITLAQVNKEFNKRYGHLYKKPKRPTIKPFKLKSNDD